jgi:arsenate reductase (thioredoxin)
VVPPDGIRRGRPPMRGGSGLRSRVAWTPPQIPTPALARPAKPAADRPRARVLFVCIGNSCRSQMAEGFARAYGADAIEVSSAGISPATIVAPLTIQTMQEKNVALDGQFPKNLEVVLREPFDIVVNMSGHPLSIPCGRMVEWQVRDPIGQHESVYRAVAAQIEELVMRLILEIRTERS